MNDVQKGYSRDRRIVELVRTHQALNTEQVTALIFRDTTTGPRKTQERLKKLAEAKRLKRCRLSQGSPFIYYLEKRSGRLEHLIALNWVYTWFLVRLASWESLMFWEYEPDYNILRADAFTWVKNKVTGESRFWFVELDLSENQFDKVEKYNRLYESGGYEGQWWVRHTKRFPGVLCVTEARADKLRQMINRDNTNGLQFEVKLLADVRREAVTWPR